MEHGILLPPDVIAGGDSLQALDLLVLDLAAHAGGGVLAQQLLAGQGEGRLERVDAVGTQEQGAGADSVQEFPVMGDDKHRQTEIRGEPALEDIDVADVEVIGGLVQDEDVGGFQARGAGDQHQPLPAAG